MHSTTVPMYRNPSLRPGLAALDAWLQDGEYTENARGRIVAYTAANGTPTGCIELDPADEYGASSVFCDAMDLVPYSSDAWSAPDVFLDVELLANGTHPFPMGPEEPERDLLGPGPILLGPDDGGPDPEPADAPDDRRSWSSHFADWIERGIVPPVAGGSEEATFEPSPTEWRAACDLFRQPEPARPGPTPSDWEEYRERFDAVEPMWGYE